MWGRLQRNLSRATLIRAGLSLVLAFVLWGWVTIENNPEVTRLVSGIPLTVTHLPQNLRVTGLIPSMALRLEGPRSELDALDPTQLHVTADLADVRTAGDVTVTVQASAPGHINVRDVYPPTVILHLQEIAGQQK